MRGCRRRQGSGNGGVNRRMSPCVRGLAALARGMLFCAMTSAPVLAQPEATTPQAAAVKVCSACHALQIVMDTPKDLDSWHDTVQTMIDRGARGTPEEFELVMDFLFQNVTTIDVNHADQESLMAVLHAPQAAAEAIMARRTSRPFKNLADLESAVPGLDKALLDGKTRMIFFQ
jgi:helix-hairpin-helix protein